MGAKAGNSKGPIVGINVTPLVDVTLVLLIIMMVSANFIAKGSIPIELPKAATGGDAPVSTIGIALDKDGVLFLNGERLTREQFIEEVSAKFAKDEKLQAVIDADRRVPHGSVVDVMDMIKAIGIYNFAISIEKTGSSVQ